MFENSNRFERHLTVEQSGIQPLDLLSEHCSLSKQQLKQCMAKGAVWLQKGKHKQRLKRIKKNLSAGETLHLYYDKEILDKPVLVATLIADLKRYSVWNKPAGMLAQGSEWGDHCSLLRFAGLDFSPIRQSFLVHRLDREASGLMLIAHDKQAAAQLSALFQKRQIDKRYRVWVQGQLTPPQIIVNQSLDGKKALSHLQLMNYDAELDQSHLQVLIETGRKHQIRRHCAAIGHAVIGDKRYGKADHRGLQLEAVSLGFMCPLSDTPQLFELTQTD